MFSSPAEEKRSGVVSKHKRHNFATLALIETFNYRQRLDIRSRNSNSPSISLPPCFPPLFHSVPLKEFSCKAATNHVIKLQIHLGNIVSLGGELLSFLSILPSPDSFIAHFMPSILDYGFSSAHKNQQEGLSL